jgi:CDP-diacylglycerol--serine O-phosphatidyltransferase
MWSLEDIGKLGWIACAIFAMAAALRLARYNVIHLNPEPKPDWAKPFFAGIPAPGGAGLALLPLFIWFQAPRFFDQFNMAAPLIAIWLILIGVLMVSRIPTFSSKQIKLDQRMALPVLGALAALAAAVIHAPWFTLSVVAVVYISSLPFAYRYYRKLEARHTDGNREDLSDLAFGVPAAPKSDQP